MGTHRHGTALPPHTLLPPPSPPAELREMYTSSVDEAGRLRAEAEQLNAELELAEAAREQLEAGAQSNQVEAGGGGQGRQVEAGGCQVRGTQSVVSGRGVWQWC